MLRDGWKSVGKVFILAMVLDVIYQLIELRRVYPGEVILVAIVLAILPYLICADWSRVWLGNANRHARPVDPVESRRSVPRGVR